MSSADEETIGVK